MDADLPAPASWPRLGYIGVSAGLVVVAACFVAAVALPLATFTTALALFGFAHVASELRYLDHRFGARMGGDLVGFLVAILVVAVTMRLSGLMGWLPVAWAVGLEIAAGAILVAVTAARLRRWRRLGGLAAAGLALAAAQAPFETLLALAIGHNLTPLALLAEALRGRQRCLALVIGTVGFIALPLLIASGWPFTWLAAAGLTSLEASLFDAGNLTSNLGTYVPASALYSDWALYAFSASVFAQCMHYVAVILVLPRLIGGTDTPLLSWPSAGRFHGSLALAAGALALGFAIDYGAQRQVYALAALVHAWLELPILVLALGGGLAAHASRSA